MICREFDSRRTSLLRRKKGEGEFLSCDQQYSAWRGGCHGGGECRERVELIKYDIPGMYFVD